jgi:sterol desaturase/sphingolipid hydroxylase (fatty acid hydroxylase superfamily)
MTHQATLITISVMCLGAAMMVVEHVHPGRKFPEVGGWLGRAISINACQVGSVLLAGVVWNGWMARHLLWSTDRLGVYPGAVAGYFVLTFVYYWWHLLRHRSNFLWRWLHQIHHSPQRLEVLTAFYKHPLEIILDSLFRASWSISSSGSVPRRQPER